MHAPRVMMQLSKSRGLPVRCFYAHRSEQPRVRRRLNTAMAQDNILSAHEMVTLSVGDSVFTVPLATLQGPAAKGSVLEQIAEQYTRKAVHPNLAGTTSFVGTSSAPTTITVSRPSPQNTDMVVMVPCRSELQCWFGQVLSCLQRMDSGLEIIRPRNLHAVMSTARELKIDNLVNVLQKMASLAPDNAPVCLASNSSYHSGDYNHPQMVGLLQQMSLQISTCFDLQLQTLQTLQQQQVTTGRLERRVDDLEDRMTAAVQPSKKQALTM